MVSPWPPSTKAVTSSTETLNSSARKVRKRALSSTPAMPTTMLCGRPQASRITHTIASSGLVMTMTNAFGQFFLMRGADVADDLGVDADEIVATHAGLARHAGGDDDDVGALDVVVTVRAANARVVILRPAPACAMSNALPCGTPSTMSNSTTSPSSLRPMSSASVPPICPAPIRAIFLRAIQSSHFRLAPSEKLIPDTAWNGLGHGTRCGVITLF